MKPSMQAQISLRETLTLSTDEAPEKFRDDVTDLDVSVSAVSISAGDLRITVTPLANGDVEITASPKTGKKWRRSASEHTSEGARLVVRAK